MKKAITLIILITLVSGVMGLAPTSRIAAASPSLATLMPVDTFFFAEVNTADLPGTVRTIADLLKKLGSPTDLVGDIDRTLSETLGRPATLEKDITSWLGDRVGMSIYIPDELFDSLFTRRQTKAQPEFTFVAAVKDEPAADAFLKDIVAAAGRTGGTLTSSTEQIGGADATLYSTGAENPMIARWKGYIALGSPSISRLVDTLKNKKPTLAGDPTYQKVNGMLKPDNFATLYSRSPLSPIEYVVGLALTGPAIGNIFTSILIDLQRTPGAKPTATPTPTPTPTPVPALFDLARLFRTMGGTAMGFYGNAKQIAVDFASYVDPDKLKEVLTILNIPADVQPGAPAPSISLKMADRVSNQAIGLIIGSNAAQLAQNGLIMTKVVLKIQDMIEARGTDSSSEVDRTYAQLESSLKQTFDLDLTQDVLGLMGGEYAAYMMFRRQPDGIQSPFSYTVLMDTADPGKVSASLIKLNAGLSRLPGLAPTKTNDGLFTVSLSKYDPVYSYGLVDNTALFHIGTDLSTVAGAVRGDGVLAADPTWKEAIVLLPKSYQNIGYVNLLKLSAAFLGISAGNQSDQQFIALISLFKSVLVYSTDLGGGSSLTTITLLLK